MPPLSEARTNPLAFAKTDCHTCTSNQPPCDRRRPRCSSCSGKNIICGGYPMQLTWFKSTPAQSKEAIFSEQTNDPFHLEPLSLQASMHVRDRNSRSQPHKPRKFRFVSVHAPRPKHTFARQCETRAKLKPASSGKTQGQAHVQQSNIVTDRLVHNDTPGSSPLETPDDSFCGEIKHHVFIFDQADTCLI